MNTKNGLSCDKGLLISTSGVKSYITIVTIKETELKCWLTEWGEGIPCAFFKSYGQGHREGGRRGNLPRDQNLLGPPILRIISVKLRSPSENQGKCKV